MSGGLVPKAEAAALASLDAARRQIVLAQQAGDADGLREWRDRAAAVEHYQRRREGGRDAALAAGEIKVRAERALGQLDAQAAPRGRPAEKVIPGKAFSDLGVSTRTRAGWRKLGDVPDTEFEGAIERLRGDENAGVTTAGVIRLTRARAASDIAARPQPAPPKGRYRTVVIDPPWPMAKITRDVRPLQAAVLDYPVQTLDEIAKLPVPDLVDPAGAHVYLWVTHKFLPAGLDLLKGWGCRYECSLTWVKPVGITPYSWMYDTEHVLFARAGKRLDLTRKGLRLSVVAPTTGHSAKPDDFYQRVEQASPAPRIDLYARRERPGWATWGNQVAA